MLRRVAMGIVWLIVFYLVMNFIESAIRSIFYPASDFNGYLIADRLFDRQHPMLAGLTLLTKLLICILFAVIGTVKGVLPGTRKEGRKGNGA